VTQGEISIDDPRAEDVRELLERHLAFASLHTPPEDVHALDIDGLVDPGVTFFSFRRGGELLGVGALKHLDEGHAEVKSMHTTEAARGRGIGRAIVDHLVGVARDRGYRRVSLETGSMQAFAPARSLYLSAGFAPCGAFGDYTPSRNSAYMTLSLDRPATPGAATFHRPAEDYDRHIGRYSHKLARAVIAAAGVRPGQRVLDVGCGPGALTTELAALLGTENVAAVDPSESFADACRRRLPGAQVDVASAESLPFDDAAFDHALSQLVVNFMTDAPAGVREMRRVTRRGGMVAAAVWDYAGEMTLLRRFWDAAVVLDPSATEHDEARMPFCTPAELGALWSTAGLAGVEVSPIVVDAGYDDFEDLWSPLELGVGPSGAYVASLPAEHREALKDELRGRLGVGDAAFRLTARAWGVTGRVG
jgi:ubiquinone/menaquinone biosynthesis C-methylase UbiE/GNAT superfamily N-acetyltransferase